MLLLRVFFIFAFFHLLLFAGQSHERLYDEYFLEASKEYSLPPLLLKKIATVESDLNPDMIYQNKNGTKDYGIMQINTIHIDELRYVGINEKNIMNPRINIHVAAKILSNLISQYGFNFEAIGRYHSNTPRFKEKWNNRLIQELKKELIQSKR